MKTYEYAPNSTISRGKTHKFSSGADNPFPRPLSVDSRGVPLPKLDPSAFHSPFSTYGPSDQLCHLNILTFNTANITPTKAR